MKSKMIVIALAALVSCGSDDIGCGSDKVSKADQQDAIHVERQQSQYAKGQPIPTFDFSLERELLRELYKIRNMKAATHSVWRSDYGTVEGDCPSYGYGLPYDTSLTNPWKSEWRTHQGIAAAMVEQPEPNGVFASKNTSATWVLCLGESGSLEPVYVESKVTVYPGPVKVDYATGRVTRSGAANMLIQSSRVR